MAPPFHTQERARGGSILRAILTDVHLWVPAGVLAIGLAILAYCAR